MRISQSHPNQPVVGQDSYNADVFSASRKQQDNHYLGKKKKYLSHSITIFYTHKLITKFTTINEV